MRWLMCFGIGIFMTVLMTSPITADAGGDTEVPQVVLDGLSKQLDASIRSRFDGIEWESEKTVRRSVVAAGIEVGSFREVRNLKVTPRMDSLCVKISGIRFVTDPATANVRLIVEAEASCHLDGRFRVAAPNATIPYSWTSEAAATAEVAVCLSADVRNDGLESVISNARVDELKFGLPNLVWADQAVRPFAKWINKAIESELRKTEVRVQKDVNAELEGREQRLPFLLPIPVPVDSTSADRACGLSESVNSLRLRPDEYGFRVLPSDGVGTHNEAVWELPAGLFTAPLFPSELSFSDLENTVIWGRIQLNLSLSSPAVPEDVKRRMGRGQQGLQEVQVDLAHVLGSAAGDRLAGDSAPVFLTVSKRIAEGSVTQVDRPVTFSEETCLIRLEEVCLPDSDDKDRRHIHRIVFFASPRRISGDDIEGGKVTLLKVVEYRRRVVFQ